jgi:hypothetical protein
VRVYGEVQEAAALPSIEQKKLEVSFALKAIEMSPAESVARVTREIPTVNRESVRTIEHRARVVIIRA